MTHNLFVSSERLYTPLRNPKEFFKAHEILAKLGRVKYENTVIIYSRVSIIHLISLKTPNRDGPI